MIHVEPGLVGTGELIRLSCLSGSPAHSPCHLELPGRPTGKWRVKAVNQLCDPDTGGTVER